MARRHDKQERLRQSHAGRYSECCHSQAAQHVCGCSHFDDNVGVRVFVIGIGQEWCRYIFIMYSALSSLLEYNLAASHHPSCPEMSQNFEAQISGSYCKVKWFLLSLDSIPAASNLNAYRATPQGDFIAAMQPRPR